MVGFWEEKNGRRTEDGWKKRAYPVISSNGLHRVACIRLFQLRSCQVEISLTDRAFPSSTVSKDKLVSSQSQVFKYYARLDCRLTDGGDRKIP